MKDKLKVTDKVLEREMMKAVAETFGSMNPKDLLKMLVGRHMSFNVEFEGNPLKIDVKIKKGEILARLKFVEEEESEDGD